MAIWRFGKSASGSTPFARPRVRDWPHSSFHRYVREGLLPDDWAGVIGESAGDFGERPGWSELGSVGRSDLLCHHEVSPGCRFAHPGYG
jgi:hypothetical protein